MKARNDQKLLQSEEVCPRLAIRITVQQYYQALKDQDVVIIIFRALLSAAAENVLYAFSPSFWRLNSAQRSAYVHPGSDLS